MKRFLLFVLTLFVCGVAIAHTINWHDGNTTTQTTCTAGDNITPPTPIGKYGYHFKEWKAYQFLEYIEGLNNVQYIDTGIIPNSQMNMYVMFMPVSGTSVPFSLGVRDKGYNDGAFIIIDGNTIYADWFGRENDIDRLKFNYVYEFGDLFEYSVRNSNEIMKVNNIKLYEHQFIPYTTCDKTIYINALNNNGFLMSTNTVIIRQYRFTIEGVADMRPARRLSDYAIGMYDTIRKQFFTNAGTGQFIAGPVIQ